jgi:hypothetical protein
MHFRVGWEEEKRLSRTKGPRTWAQSRIFRHGQQLINFYSSGSQIVVCSAAHRAPLLPQNKISTTACGTIHSTSILPQNKISITACGKIISNSVVSRETPLKQGIKNAKKQQKKTRQPVRDLDQFGIQNW